MEDPGRLGLQHWAMDHNHLKDHLKDHPALKLMDVIGERDAAVLERNTAIAERKMAYAERDAALLQRDVAYADRNAALMERDAAVAALAMVRVEGDPRQGSATEAASKLMQMVNMAVGCPTMEAELQTVPRGNTEMGNTPEVELQTVPRGNTEMGNILDATQSLKQGKQEKKAPKNNARKRKAPVQASHDSKRTKNSSKRKRKQQASQEPVLTVDKPKQDQGMKASNSLLFDCTTLPIPYCSCTGMNQQCYRWGNGGWQSACCTNFVSMYPLPMNPNKRGSRLPGRKMSGGAFKKILERLAGEGVNISDPLDLKYHWAKHGTNRYVTKK